MIQGAIRPASTYWGTVCVHFGLGPVPSKSLLRTMQPSVSYTPCVLVVRLHRGLYLDAFAGQSVSLAVQVGGCHPAGNPARRNLLVFHAEVSERAKRRAEVQAAAEAALSAAQQAVALEPRFAKGWLRQGEAQAALGKAADAIASLKLILRG